MVCNPVVLSKK